MTKLRVILRRWLGICDDFVPDKETVRDLEMTRRELEVTKRELLSVQQQLITVQGLLSAEQTAHAITKQKLREQTEADLLLISFKIIVKIIQGNKPVETEVNRQFSLQQALAQQTANLGQRGYGLLGQLGASAIFGRSGG